MQILAGGRRCWILCMRMKLLNSWTIWRILVEEKSFATFTISSRSHLLGFRSSSASSGLCQEQLRWEKNNIWTLIRVIIKRKVLYDCAVEIFAVWSATRRTSFTDWAEETVRNIIKSNVPILSANCWQWPDLFVGYSSSREDTFNRQTKDILILPNTTVV